MLIDLFIKLVIGFISLFPSLPVGLKQDFSIVYECFSLANYYLPIDTIFYCLTLYVLLFKFKFTFKLIKWLISVIIP